MLLQLIQGVKKNPRTMLNDPLDKEGVGRKGELPRKTRKYTNVVNHDHEAYKGRFTEVWHNNLPLIIYHVVQIRPGKVCGHCGKDFPKGILSCRPFDIAIKHSEKWKYPKRERRSDSEPAYKVSSTTSIKYYCINKVCIKSRFPYFIPNILEVSNDFKLEGSHKKLIKDELEVGLQ